jgi:uncharacterized membrane protein YfcA
MAAFSLICLGLVSGAGAGLLAGLVGIDGGVVIVPVTYYGLPAGGFSANERRTSLLRPRLLRSCPPLSPLRSVIGAPATPISPSSVNGAQASVSAS